MNCLEVWACRFQQSTDEENAESFTKGLDNEMLDCRGTPASMHSCTFAGVQRSIRTSHNKSISVHVQYRKWFNSNKSWTFWSVINVNSRHTSIYTQCMWATIVTIFSYKRCMFSSFGLSVAVAQHELPHQIRFSSPFVWVLNIRGTSLPQSLSASAIPVGMWWVQVVSLSAFQ